MDITMGEGGGGGVVGVVCGGRGGCWGWVGLGLFKPWYFT